MNTTEIETEFTPDEIAAAMAHVLRAKRASQDLRAASAAVLATAFDASIPSDGEACFALVYRGEQRHLSGLEFEDRGTGERYAVWLTSGVSWIPDRFMPPEGFADAVTGHAPSMRTLGRLEAKGDLDVIAPGPNQSALVKRALAAFPRDEGGLLMGRVVFATRAEEISLILDAIGWDARDTVAQAARAKLAKSKAATPSQESIAEQVAKLRISLGETL